MPLNRNTKIIRDDYRAWIRLRPCCGCGVNQSVCAHLKARGWGEGKRNDFTSVPLCNRCHKYQEDCGIKAYNEKFKVDLWQEATWCLIEFFLDQERQMERVG